MLIGIVSLIVLVMLFIVLAIFVMVEPGKLPAKAKTVALLSNLLIILVVYFAVGPAKIQNDLARLMRNSKPKSAAEIYAVIFMRQAGTCVRFVNLQDELIPYKDCCFWMELKTCKNELDSIFSIQPFQFSGYRSADSLTLLSCHPSNPDWWNLRLQGDSIYKAEISSARKRQSLYFSGDSTTVFVCDEAL